MRQSEFGWRREDSSARIAPNKDGHGDRSTAISRAFLSDVSRVLDYLSVGIMILDARRNLALTNRYAGEVLRENDGLYLEEGSLRSEAAEITNKLQGIILSASESAENNRHAIRIPRPSGLRSLLVFAASTGNGSAAIFIVDPERETSIDPGLIGDLFGLTPAESAVASLVVRGERLTEIAGILNISIHTARCHLKHVFCKTGTERQAELANRVGIPLGKLSIVEADDPAVLSCT